MRLLEWEGGPADTEATQSFAELIEWWIDALTTGAWAYDASVGSLMAIHERLEPARRATGIV